MAPGQQQDALRQLNCTQRAARPHPHPVTLPRPLACRRSTVSVRAAKELHFNRNMEALKKMQAGADKLATVVGVTIGPKVRRSMHAARSVCTPVGQQCV